MHANERGLLPSAAVAVPFNYRNGMIAYLLIIFSCICCNSLLGYQFSGGSNGFSVEKGLKKSAHGTFIHLYITTEGLRG